MCSFRAETPTPCLTGWPVVAGMVPLALAVGAGSQMLQPLAIAVIGGIVVSMFLSLVVTPGKLSIS